MSKIATSVVILCAILAAPVLGVWKYKGTDVWITEPGSEYDPEGAWYYTWDGEGSIDADPLYLDASGWVRCETHVQLWAYYDNHSQASAYVAAYASATSHYEWEEGGGSKSIWCYVPNWVDPGSGIDYAGIAVDPTHVSTVHTASGADARASSSVTNGGWVDTGGYGSGQSTCQSGSTAGNGPHGSITVSEDYADWGYPAPYLYNQWFEGSYQFTAEDEGYIECDWDQTFPQILEFNVDVRVGGSCVSVGNITINGLDYQYLRLASGAIFYISGETYIQLYGNIE